MVSFDLSTGGLNHRYPTLCGQRITTDGCLIEQFRFLVQIYWLIMNGFALVLEDLEDFSFCFIPCYYISLSHSDILCYLNGTL